MDAIFLDATSFGSPGKLPDLVGLRVPDLEIASIVLTFIFYGGLNNFWIPILSQIFIEHLMRYKNL